MLKSINPLLTGELLAILSDMGHGDEIVISDANFPAATIARRLARLPGISATDALAAVLSGLLASPAQRQGMGQAGRRLAEEFSTETITDRWETLYRSVQQGAQAHE